MLTREQQKTKALERMVQLGLKPAGFTDTYDAFNKRNEVWYSAHTPFGGILYDLSDNIKEVVKDFEDKHNALVYHIVQTPTNLGNMWAFLYVSSDEDTVAYDDECMQYELKNIKDGNDDSIEIHSYVYNETDPWLSEFGYIRVREVAGGLIRTW